MSNPSPRYTLWDAMHAALNLSLRAIEEVRALSRQPGPPGEPGREGPPGKLPLCREWGERVYYEGQVVSHKGGTYQARCDTAREPPHADWITLALPGMDGRAPEVRGTYQEGGEYRGLDIVALNGGSFIARTDNPGPCPGDGWQLLTSPGKRGQKGEDGKPGPRGEPGSSGPIIVAWKNDPNAYAVTPLMSDGSEGPPLDLRGFFEQFLSETGHP